MQFKNEYVLARIPMQNATQIFGDEAKEILLQQGLKLVHVDDDGRIYALDERNQYINGLMLYMKKVPVFAV